MNSKDKPKRGEGRTFIREIKPKASTNPGAPAKANAGLKKKFAKTGFVKPTREPAKADAVAGAPAEPAGAPERISKFLARAGIASRRDVERMIMEGRVKLNGAVLDTPVVNVTLQDRIEVDDAPIRGIERTRLWLYHKPAGLVTTNSDPEGRPTVFENLPADLPRVLSIGRLDINTEGLLLLTNDGGLSRVLELPTTGWLRRYRVRAHGEIDQEALDKLKEGIAVDGVLYGSIDATLDRSQGRNVWITLGLREGKNREVKNVLGALGLEVNRLIRISYGPFQLGDLPEGHVVEVRGRMLRDQLGPRLIEEAKANFDAPIYNDRDVERERPPLDEQPASDQRKPSRPRSSRPDDRREAALARLDTRPGERRSGDKPQGKGLGKRGRSDDRGPVNDGPKKRPPLGTTRTANVWMAPGARPTVGGKTSKASARSEAEQLFRKDAGSERRVVVNRAEDDRDWIRSEEPARRSRDGEGGDFGRKRAFGGRPERAERDGADRPRGERGFGDRPRGDRQRRHEEGEGPSRARSFRTDDRSEPNRGGHNAGETPRSGKPAGKSFAGKRGGSKGFSAKGSGGHGKPPGKPGGRSPAGGGPRDSGARSGGPRSGRPKSGGKPRTPRG